MAAAVVVMGVSGAGKTTVGRLLADQLGWEFVEGDDHHSPESIEKMAAGTPLSDRDRWPWLDRLRALLIEQLDSGQSLVLACSALNEAYRGVLVDGDTRVHVVYLKADLATIEPRIESRQGHYMKVPMLAGQFQALEEPENGIVADAAATPTEIVARVIGALEARGVRTS